MRWIDEHRAELLRVIEALVHQADRYQILDEEREWIDSKLSRGDSYWTDVAVDCSRHCQYQSLELLPWENPPMYGDIDRPRLDQRAFDLLRKLLSLNLSRFEPHPLAAIAEAEAKRKEAAEELTERLRKNS